MKSVIAPAGLLVAVSMFALTGNMNQLSRQQLNFQPEPEVQHRRLQGTYDTSVSQLPAAYMHAANVWDPLVASDQPVFWYLSKCGGATFASVVAKCLGVVQCSPKGDSSGKAIPSAPSVEVVTHDDDQGRYLNINPINAAGMALLGSENVVPNRVADIIITPRVYDAGALMSPANAGRFMVMLRHPVKREIDMFYYRQSATWDPNFDTQLATMSVGDYVDSDKMLDNFMTRSLLGLAQDAMIMPQDVASAKAVLRQKFVVGIFEWYDASLSRFEKYVGWWDQFNVNSDAVVNQCHYDEVRAHNHDAGSHPDVPAGSMVWNKFIMRSWADVELYAYAKHLYSEQSALFV